MTLKLTPSFPARFLGLLLTGLIHFALCLGAVAEEATLTIGDRELHAISPDIFGQFLERPSWGGEFGPEAVCDDRGKLSVEIERHLAAMHATIVRFPVGTDGDYIDWTDMINLPGRAQRPVTIGHKQNRVTNRFGFDEYFELAERLGWRTILVANLRDALYKKKPLAAADHAAALAAYCGAKVENDSAGWAATRATNGHAKPWNVAAMQIGNEGWCFWPPKPEERGALGLTDDESCARWLRECLVAYADAIHKVIPGLPLITDAPRPLDGGGLENNSALVWRKAVDSEAVRSRYQMLAAHAYAPMGMWLAQRHGTNVSPAKLTQDEIWNALVGSLGRFDANGQCIADAAAYDDIQKLGYRAAATEWNWNGWDFAKKFPQASFGEGVPAALGAAGFLHGLMRHPNVAIANQSMLLGTTWNNTAVRVGKDKSVSFLPQAEAVRFIAEHHGDKIIASTLVGVDAVNEPVRLTSWWPQVNRVSDLDALVTADSHALYVHLINRQREHATKLVIKLPSRSAVHGTAIFYKLIAKASFSTIATEKMARVSNEMMWRERKLTLNIPAASISVLSIPCLANANLISHPRISRPQYPKANIRGNL